MPFFATLTNFERGSMPPALLFLWEQGGFLGMVMGNTMPMIPAALLGPRVPFSVHPPAASSKPEPAKGEQPAQVWKPRHRCFSAKIPCISRGLPSSPD